MFPLAATFVRRLNSASDAALNALNLEPYAHYDRLVERILGNVRNRVNYERLADHGPKLGPVTAQCPVVATYFTRLPVPEHDQVSAGQGPSASMPTRPDRAEGLGGGPGAQDNAESYMVVNNGWIYNGDPLTDFAAAGSDSYLARDVVIWGDCVKLRYGPNRVPSIGTPRRARRDPLLC